MGDISDNADLGRQAQYINELLNFAEKNEIPMQNTASKQVLKQSGFTYEGTMRIIEL